MLGCGNPDKMGYIEYRCLHCGEGKHRVAMSCKSSLCLRCAKVYVDHWVSQVSQMLHEGVIYRHIVLTMPAMLRQTFYQHADTLLSAFMRCGVQCLDDFFSRSVARRSRVATSSSSRPMAAMASTTRICTSLRPVEDGISRRKQWVHFGYLPYPMLRKKWQWHLLTMVRQTVDEGDRSVGRCVLQALSRGVCDQCAKGRCARRGIRA